MNLQLGLAIVAGWEERKFNNLLVFMGQSTPIRKIQFASFAVMHSRAATCFVFSVELKMLAVTKILPRVYDIAQNAYCSWDIYFQ